MEKVLHLPDLTELEAERILQNVSNAVCQPFPKAMAIVQELDYLAYKHQRLTMSAAGLETIGYPHALMHEGRFEVEEAEKASEGES